MLKNLYLISTILSIIGAINWGVVGLFDKNLVTLIAGSNIVGSGITGSGSSIAKLIYMLIGASGCVLLTSLLKRI